MATPTPSAIKSLHELMATRTPAASKSVRELMATPTSRRKLNATYVKSRVRNIIPEYASFTVKDVVENMSNQLKEIGLAGSMWETYQINALYGFKYKKISSYEKILTSQVKKDASQIESDLQTKFQNFIVKIQHFPEMVFSERDNPPLKITIVGEAEDGCQIPCFTGFLLSVERKVGFMEKERIFAGAVILPLFLVDYTDRIFLESVKFFFEDNFSCYTGTLKFSSYDLIFMLFLFSSPDEDKCTSSTIIEYKVPSADLSSIEYAMDPNTVSEIWQKITEPLTESISETEVFEFLSVLEEHFYKMFSINLSYLDLHVIKTPLARVQADHSIIVWESHKLYYVMRHLTHLAQEMIHL